MEDVSSHLENKLKQNLFLIESLMCDSRDEMKLYFKLCDLLHLPVDKTLLEACVSATVREIDTVESFYLHERVKKLYAMSHIESPKDKYDELIAIKGQALKYAQGLNLSKSQGISDAEKRERVAALANSGAVPIMFGYGFMQYHGIGVDEDRESGISFIRKAAEWNHFESILFMLGIGEDRQSYLNRLFVVASSTPYKDAVKLVEKQYGLKAARHDVAKLTEDLFKRGIINREQYSFQLGRVLGNSLLSLHSKQKIAYSDNKSLISVAATFPRNVGDWSVRSTDVFDKLPIARYSEPQQISIALQNQKFAAENNHLPICFNCDDAYVLDYYAKKIREEYPHINFIPVDISDIGVGEFQHCADGVFLRSLREDSINALLIKCIDVPDKQKTEEVQRILQSSVRKNYQLEYGFPIDLSKVVPICFCDAQSLSQLQRYCNVFNLPKLNKQEKTFALNDTLSTAKKAYNADGLKLEDGAIDALDELSTEMAVRVIERVVQSRRGLKDSVVTKAQMQSYVNDSERLVSQIGFGRTK